MGYDMEELLPIAAWLTNQFTSGESSSVPYETGRRLMEAVIYSIEESAYNVKGALPTAKEGKGARAAYEKGYAAIIDKVYEAKALYNQLLPEFEDYGCRNYGDTVLKGMPAFFIKYEPRFWPQNHIRTLDYPLLSGNPDLCGIDLILEYLKGIYLEKQFLDCFDREAVSGLLERILPEYEELYLDNICYPVLLNAVGCMIADKPVGKLKLFPEDYRVIEAYLKKDSLEEIKLKVQGLICVVVKQAIKGMEADYFLPAGSSYSIRLWQGIRSHSLDTVIA